MPDEFVNLVSFRATGLDRIELDLDKVKAASDAAVPSMERLFGVAKKGTQDQAKGTAALAKSVETLGRVAKSYQSSFAFALAGMGPGNARYNQSLSYNRSLGMSGGYSVNPAVAAAQSQRWTWGGAGRAAGAIGSGAGAAATAVGAAAFTTGVAGLSGTVPMAKLQNQFQRLAWELGNTLTPQIEAVTKRVAGAANWLSRQSEGTQDAIGYGVTGLGLAAGARLAGIPVGAGAKGLASLGARGAMGLLGMAGARAGASALPASLSLDAAAGGGLLGAAGSAVGLAALPIYAAFQSKSTRLAMSANEARRNRGDTSGLGDLESEYAKKWGALSADGRRTAAAGEFGRLLSEERTINAGRGALKGPNDPGSTANLLFPALPWLNNVFGLSDNGLMENQGRQAIARKAMAGGKLNGNHRANAFVGGDYREIGSGYYEAASAFAKAGFDQAEGGESGKSESIIDILTQIRDRLPNASQPPAPTGNETNLRHSVPGF